MIDMANNRKVLQLSSKHRTKAEKARREYEESLIQSDGTDLDEVTASQFVNTTARKEYDRALKRLREEVGMVGNLNKSDLLNYANSYGRYMDLVKEVRKKDFTYIVQTRGGPKPNPLVKMIRTTINSDVITVHVRRSCFAVIITIYTQCSSIPATVTTHVFYC